MHATDCKDQHGVYMIFFYSIHVLVNLPSLLSSFIQINRVKRKPLIFKFKWNFCWILSFFHPKLDLSLVMYPPPPTNEKVGILGEGDILVLGDVALPSPGLEIFCVADLT